MCEEKGGPSLCVSEGIIFACSVCVWAIAVFLTQTFLILFRLRHLFKWRTAKSVIFYAVAFQNLALSLQSWFTKTAEVVLHLLHDYSKFLLYTTLFYYFAMHTFHIIGSARTSVIVIWSIATLNVVYLSGSTAYIAYQLEIDAKQDSCKGRN